MKILIVVAVLLLVGYILYRLNPSVALVTSGTLPSVDSRYSITDSQLVLHLTLRNADKPHSVTALWIPMDLRDAAGMGDIDGFVHTPATTDDGYTAEEAEEKNREEWLLTGAHPLEPDVETQITIPVHITDNLSGTIRGLLESKRAIGGSISFLSIDIGENPDA